MAAADPVAADPGDENGSSTPEVVATRRTSSPRAAEPGRKGPAASNLAARGGTPDEAGALAGRLGRSLHTRVGDRIPAVYSSGPSAKHRRHCPNGAPRGRPLGRPQVGDHYVCPSKPSRTAVRCAIMSPAPPSAALAGTTRPLIFLPMSMS